VDTERTLNEELGCPKLAGAAHKSFMIKCERDAKSAWDADTKARKVAGATKNSHMKKCVSEVANFQKVGQ